MDKEEAKKLELEMDYLGSEEITADREKRMQEIAHLLVMHYSGKDDVRDTSICNQTRCKDNCHECLFENKKESD